MRKIVIGGITAAFAASAAFGTAVFAGGNGAEHSGIAPQSGSTLGGQCQSSDGSGGNGFVMFNAPGQPGNANKLIGEVALKNATPNTSYMVSVSVGNNNCMPETTLTTNEVGNGNAHIADTSLANGTFYVVLLDSSGNEVYASGPVSVN